MLEFAQYENPDLIILTEGSDSCGTNMILDPENIVGEKNAFKKGSGLAAALLIKNNFQVMSHKDEKNIIDFFSSDLNLKTRETIPVFGLGELII